MLRKWGTLVLFLLALPAMAWAQNTGKISGRVTDAETGEPLPGATVVIEGTTLGSATDTNGNYTIFEVSPGTITLVASYVGYQSVRRENVEIIGGITSRQDFALGSGALELDMVEVVAERPLVNPTATNAVRRFSREEFEALPTRDASTYYAIQPGVTTQNGQVYIRGGRPDETEYLLEGISSRSLLGTDNVVPVIPEALEEVQVYAGGYSAEYGNANAGIVQQTLRTGGQQLSGLVQYETDGAADALGDYSYGYNDLTVTLGGPLLWNKHRFFVALNKQGMDNYDPQWFYGADFGVPVDDITGDTASAPLNWKDGKLPGIGRPEDQLRANGTLLFDFRPLRVRVGFAHMTRERRLNSLPIYNLFNQERLGQRDDVRSLANVQANYFLSDRTYLEATAGVMQYNFEVYDPLFGTPEADGQGGAVLDLIKYYSKSAVAEALAGDPEKAELYTQYWRGDYTQPSPFIFNGFNFARPGRATTTYNRREQGYVNFALGLTSQQDIHELKVGGNWQRWTVRDYSFSGSTIAQLIQNDPTYVDSIRQELPSVAATIRRAGHGGYGYDEFMNEVDDGPDGAKNPVTASLYVNDKMEFNDIIVNAGLRWDYYDMDLFTVADPANPGFDAARWTVEGLTKAKAHSVLQPRLGFSFPVTNRSVFHLQYGKFAQMPDMAFVYEDRADMATVLAGQFFISDPFAFDLEPIKTTQYEIGMGHQFTDFAAFDVTAFYRKTQGQLEIVRQETVPESQADAYNLYQNGDFAIARGVEFSLRTRRVGNFMGIANYTLTDAKGTNSQPGGQVSALENGTAPPSLIQPLIFEQRHRGSFILDYRTGEQPTSMLAQNWTVDLLLRFNSGRRFTRSTGSIGQRGADEGPLLVDSDPRSRSPLEPLNSSTTPWVFLTDLRVEKGFSFGAVRTTAYAYVENLLNTRSILNVYLRTGDATSDGFLTNPDLSEQIVSARGEDYVSYYQNINLANRQHFQRDWGYDLYGQPRQVRIGLRVDF